MPGPRLFFIDSKDIIDNKIAISNAALRHITKVLRLGIGDKICVADEGKKRYLIELTDINHKKATGKILETKEATEPPPIEIILLQSILKGGKMDMLIQKATELGVSKILPVITERTIVKIKEGADRREERWQRIAKEASQQCGRWDIPIVWPLRRFEDAFNDIKDVDLALILWEGEHINKLRDILRGRAQTGIKKVCLLVGPEGGFTREEVKFAMEKGFIPASLGDLILRAETAAITIISIVQYEFGDIG
ncbi:MAG: 16S rRNA (uracil(1498)-N(3))-methyltransferase [Nitrospirae bacterium]|nr:16S rRNA (uracil(1498)-N(3))-methyltransferase [Nitrospirota bacterium]